MAVNPALAVGVFFVVAACAIYIAGLLIVGLWEAHRNKQDKRMVERSHVRLIKVPLDWEEEGWFAEDDDWS
jgi:hypothetical protein